MAKPKVEMGCELGLTVVIPTAVLVGALVSVAFYATGFSLFQKIVVMLVALLVSIAAVSLLWIRWAKKHRAMGQFKGG